MRAFTAKRTTPCRALRLSAAVGLLLAALLPLPAQDAPADRWTSDLTIYGLGAAMSGDVTVRGVTADMDTPFSTILENLEFGFMGKLRLSKGPWAVTADVIYMGLGGSKNGVTADFDQWVVEPSASYRVSEAFELLAGFRYNSISGEIRGPGVLPVPRIPSGTVDWLDPIVGFNYAMPVCQKWTFNLRGDVGGFGLGSDLTWQAFPYFSWHFSATGSLQAGYRWVYTDYETGSGTSRFRYDVLTQGPQLGATWRF